MSDILRGADRQEVERAIARSTTASGVPKVLEDPATIAAVAVLVSAAT